ncbi:TPA: acyltransferase family protein [Streptococcus pyogenes]|uniref:acyltransferase family protein n=1 Tax=Streptococcus pyogenes TaxID=1314 RepID=UPI000971C8EB|nr:acyltransferase family protein [Streptococcus pyogenes]HER4546725.1 acetyltransferase [Streptococcus pyogenes NGAS726]HER4626395.1 acetyltransferase [Streptococcus pyogenes NGAS604]HER4675427.1 acetyltransferase [Streptococcus pyogenes NGAS344]ARV00420.1 acyltransferase [Streptococcus pyogenes]ASQ20401.1 acetyltransferase [Streptococcus pyogenes]
MRIKWFSFVRVTGLLLVLLYHFFKNVFPGGFIGVDIFFTFSGYLITALLIDEYTKKESIDIIGFLKRRFYRIVPPLVLMILLTIPFTFLIKKDFIANIGSQITAVLGFTTNIYEILTGSSYESQFIPHLFVHTWSLAIEVHFYLLWGVFVWLLARRKETQKQLRGLLFLISLGIFAISFLSMFIRSFMTSNFSLIYFSSLSHSFPFFLGAMFATITGINETTVRFQKNVRLWPRQYILAAMIGAFTLLLVLTVTLDFNHITTYLFGFALASLFASIMIYAARVLHEQTPDVQEPKAITYIADISYGIYLFHWPFYIIFSQLMSHILAVILTVFFSILFATVSYYIVEPLVQGRKPNLLGLEIDCSPYYKWIVGGSLALALLTLGTCMIAPKVGKFEKQLLVSSLQQAQSNMERTHTLAAGDANALSDVGIIGDSVALRSSAAFSKIMPQAQLDAAVSRNFKEAFDLFNNQIKSKSLSKTVVLAVGVNSLDNYSQAVQSFIEALPKGHRLVLVSPYNAKNASQVAEARDYGLKLSKKYKYVTIADWYKVAVEHPDIWYGSDGVHYSEDSQGAELYVSTIQTAVEKSAKKPAK